MTARFVGESVKRYDIGTKVAGSRKYPQDFSMDGQLYAKVVWSEHAHARIRSIDVYEAEAMAGVRAVLTYKDVPVNEFGINIMDQRVLAQDKVYSVGDPVALVVAESEKIARKAVSKVRVEYDPLPVVSDARLAMEPAAPLVHEDRESNVLRYIPIRRGDMDQGWREADVIVEGHYYTPRVEHAFMQPEAGLGYIDSAGRVTVICASQWAQDDVRQIAHALDLPEDQVHEIVPAIGGAFGGREDVSLQILVALAAHVVRQPVKMVYSRAESMRGHGKRHPFYMSYRTGATREGRLTAMEVTCVIDAGAAASTSIPVLSNGASFLAGPYYVPHAHIDAYAVYTNNIYTMAIRGFGATQPPAGYEAQMEKLAEALGMDPVELRMRNLLEDGMVAVTGNTMTHGTGIKQTLEDAALAAGWTHTEAGWSRPDVGPASAPHKTRGLGIACGYKNVGYSFGYDDTSTARVELRLDARGQIETAMVRIGAAEVGQGVLTTMSQIAADALNIDIHRVRMIFMDTAEVPNAGSSSASRQTYVSGNAVLLACEKALERYEEVLRAKEGERTLEVEATYYARSVVPTTDYDPATGQCEPHISYSYGTQAALVEVDEDTGEIEVLKMYAATDVGRVIHPANVFGQVAGGIHMGVGYALTEEFLQVEGQIASRSFTQYQIPTIRDMPAELHNRNVEVRDPTGPFGATGLGETPTLPTAPAILNAIHDAAGVWIDSLPATAEKLYWALREKRST
jgi:CO/xanthine dehydrogenase Mo-binding subunit